MTNRRPPSSTSSRLAEVTESSAAARCGLAFALLMVGCAKADPQSAALAFDGGPDTAVADANTHDANTHDADAADASAVDGAVPTSDAAIDDGSFDAGRDAGIDAGQDAGHLLDADVDAGDDGCEGAPEYCNTLDDDCDGAIDEDTCVLGVEFNVGRSEALHGTALLMTNNQVIAQPLLMPIDVEFVGIAMTVTGVGGAAYYTLHADDAGEPGAVINTTTSPVIFNHALRNFRSRHSALPSATRLSAGTRYWVVASIDVQSGEAPAVHRFDEAASAGAIRIGEAPYPFRDDLIGLTTQSEGQVSLYAVVKPWSQAPSVDP